MPMRMPTCTHMRIAAETSTNNDRALLLESLASTSSNTLAKLQAMTKVCAVSVRRVCEHAYARLQGCTKQTPACTHARSNARARTSLRRWPHLLDMQRQPAQLQPAQLQPTRLQPTRPLPTRLPHRSGACACVRACAHACMLFMAAWTHAELSLTFFQAHIVIYLE